MIRQLASNRAIFSIARYSTTFPNVVPTEPITMYDTQRNKVTTSDLFAKGKKVVLFGIPGAFTPVCTNKHVPSFLEKAKDLKGKHGITDVACVSVNDAFVMKAWQDQVAKESEDVLFLADPSGQFVKSIDLNIDLTNAGLGPRSKRFSMIVDDGKVVALNVEDSPGDFKNTGADKIIEQLTELK
ncbi:peroxiredoxin [Acrasis kona]|uniref:Peroxiredoxin n=1 Tax=Acrasis kona TaxID=1008807 RepID=A0AAW2Z9U5_9EUKA